MSTFGWIFVVLNVVSGCYQLGMALDRRKLANLAVMALNFAAAAFLVVTRA